MVVTGRIREVLPARTGVSQRTGETWMSQEYVLDYFWWPNQTMASQMLFQVFGENRIKEFNLQVNDEVRMEFHVEANFYDGRWFNKLQCTRVTKMGEEARRKTDGNGGGGAGEEARRKTDGNGAAEAGNGDGAGNGGAGEEARRKTDGNGGAEAGNGDGAGNGGAGEEARRKTDGNGGAEAGNGGDNTGYPDIF